MARTLYGASLGDYGIDGFGHPTPHATFEVWSALVDGAHLTDLLDYTGTVSTVAVADDQGFVRLSGPDGWTDDLYAQDINGGRFVLRPVNLTARLGTAEGTLAAAVATVTAIAAVTGDGSDLTRNTAINLALAATPEVLAVGAITLATDGSPAAMTLAWPDGATGTFTADTHSAGAVDSYHVTHVLSGVTTTYTQSAVTRDGSGNLTNRPVIVVS